MTSERILLVLILMHFFSKILCIWPPPYEIKLTDAETFVISEFIESDDVLNDEDEMINPNDVKPSKNHDLEKFRRIHQMALRRNKKELEEKNAYAKDIKKIEERNFDLEDSIPWEGGFVDNNGNFIQPENENVYYLNEMAKSLIDSKIDKKREDTETSTEEEKVENYDYNSFKAEYAEQVKKAEASNDTFNFTDVKEEETAQEAIKTIVDFKDAQNCTEEESRGIGYKAWKCIIADLKNPRRNIHSTIRLIEIILKITLIWFGVYLVIAIPCWCTRGWCCCCCRCKCCRPREVLDEAKKFYMDNPPGVFHNDKGETITFKPTNYEIYAQKRLERALFNL